MSYSLFQAFRKKSAAVSRKRVKLYTGKTGEGGGGARASEHAPVFPVYNLTRSLLTAALYYLNAWTKLNELSQLWAPGIILQPRPQGAFHWLQRPGNEVDNLSAPALG